MDASTENRTEDDRDSTDGDAADGARNGGGGRTIDRRRVLAASGVALGVAGLGGVGSAHQPDEKNPYAHEFDSAYHENYTNSNRGAAEIDWIVVHITDGSFSSAVNWFKDPDNPYDTSAHYVIRNSDGYCKQMVRDEDLAHHAAGFNSPSIGIEHEWTDGQNGISDASYDRSAKIVNHIAEEYNIPKEYYTDPCAAANASGGIVGHIENPEYCGQSANKSCPYPAWDWDRYMDFVNGTAGGGGGGGSSYSWPYFSRGDQNTDIYSVQYLLEEHGYELQYHDGIFGSGTEQHVEEFQSARGLAVDGVVGPNTWTELVVGVLGPNQDPWWATYAVQHNLKHDHGHNIAVDGYYGAETESAIETFQGNSNLSVDGQVSTETWKALVDK